MSAFNEDTLKTESSRNLNEINSYQYVSTHEQSSDHRENNNHSDGELPAKANSSCFSAEPSTNSQVIVTEIDRSHRQLTDIPSMSAQTSGRIRSLHLQRNTITRLPSSIVLFEKLQYLDVSNNAMHSLSQELCDLRQLHTLIARNNQLTDESLPKHLDHLNQLEVLNLSGNQLTQMPEKLSYLTNLKQLSLASNQIKIMPPCIGMLTKLVTLNLGSNRLIEVPEEIGNLRNLTTLSLAENRILKLPEGAFKLLISLKSLQLHNNQLSLLPPEIVKLNLVELSVRNNPLVMRFVQDLTFEPPSMQELAARVIKTKNVQYTHDDLPETLINYLNTAHSCVNPKCKGVYFTSYVKNVKFVDFCGKYHIPLMEYLCSPTCHSNSNILSESSDSEDEVIHRMRRVLLG